MKNRFPLSITLIIVLLLPVLAGCAPKTESADAADTAVLEALPAEVTVETAHQMREDGALMLDVRELDEWAAGHMPDAVFIPLGELESRTAELPTDVPIVVYCRSGNRSAVGRDILLGAGFPAVTSMAGGFNAWAAAGYKSETGE